MTHVERSRGALLDIVIETSLWSKSKHLALVPSLDIVSSLAHRWHRLSIAYLFSFNEGEDESDDTTLAEFIIGRINHLHFPSLKYIAISYCNAASLNFLSPTRTPTRTPTLEHLELKEFVAKRTDFPLSIHRIDEAFTLKIHRDILAPTKRNCGTQCRTIHIHFF